MTTYTRRELDAIVSAIERLEEQGWTIRPAGQCLLVALPDQPISAGRYVSLLSLRDTSDPYRYIRRAVAG